MDSNERGKVASNCVVFTYQTKLLVAQERTHIMEMLYEIRGTHRVENTVERR